MKSEVLLISVCLFVFGSAHYQDGALTGYCPDGWKHMGYICYRIIYENKDYLDSLDHCNDIKEHHANTEDYIEDISNLLTLAKLREFLRDRDRLYYHLGRDKYYRLNAIRWGSAWYAIHRFPEWKIKSKRDLEAFIMGEEDAILKLTGPEFDIDPDFDDSEADDLDTLVLHLNYTGHARLKIRHREDRRSDFICTHKPEGKPGGCCAGKVHECNDNGNCINHCCYCYKGYANTDDKCGPCIFAGGGFGLGYKTFLFAGSGTRANLFDLDTSTFCDFPDGGKDFGSDSRGQYFPDQDKVLVCEGSECWTFQDGTWTDGPNPPFSFDSDPHSLLDDGRWLITGDGDDSFAWSIYNPADDSFTTPTQVAGLNGDTDDGWCMARLSATLLGIITESGNAYTYDFATNTLSGILASVPNSGWTSDEGSCHAQLVPEFGGALTIIWFPGQPDDCKIVYWNTVTNEMTQGHPYPTDCDRDDHISSPFTAREMLFAGGENSDTGIYTFSVTNGFTKVGDMDQDREELSAINVPPSFLQYATCA